jgi:glycyl-tRNA synthetase
MAEIEHYVDPTNKNHPRFEEVREQKLRLLPASVQLEGNTELLEITVGEAVDKVGVCAITINLLELTLLLSIYT